MRAFQMSNFKNKNCSELLLTNGMGLDGAPVKFLTLVFLRPPNGDFCPICIDMYFNTIVKQKATLFILKWV